MLTLLAIDDQPDNLTSLGALVKQFLPECALLTAASGREGIDKARRSLPDAVLLDIQMPGLDGYETCRILKSDEATRHIPVVFVTARSTDAASRVRGLEIGGDAFLAKPIDPAEFVAQVRAMLRIKQAEDALRAEKADLEARVASRTRELEESEQRFRLLFERAPLGYQSLDADGRIIDVNQSWLDLLGYAREEVVSRWFGDFLVPEELGLFRERFPRFKAAGEVHGVEFEMVRKDGSHVLTSFDGRIGYDEQAQFKQTHCILTDIGERKRAEDELRRSRAQLLAAQRVARLGNWRLDAATGAVEWSDEMFTVFGLDPAGGPPTFEGHRRLIHPDDWESFDANVRRGLTVGGTTEMRFRAVLPDGSVRHVEAYGEAARDAAGRPVAVYGTAQDVTERYEAELRIQRSETLYNTTVNALRDWIHVVDPELRIVLANRAFTDEIRRLGFRGELAGRRIDEVCPFAGPAVIEEYRRCFAAGVELHSEDVSESEGRTIYVETKKTPVVEDGRTVRVVTTMRDTTEHRRLEEQFRHAQKMEAVGSLAGGVAHDFNNLLQAMVSTTEVMRAQYGGRGAIEAHVKELRGYIDRGAQLTRQLLLFSRRDATKREVVNLNALLVAVTGMLRRLVPEHVALDLELSTEALPLCADRGQLEQVITNLVLNAVDAMPDGGQLRVRTDRAGDDRASLTVADTGHGIPGEIRTRIFDPFFTTKATGKGTGLGLSVVHGIVASHNGTIEVESTVGAGTTFRITLPVASDAPPAADLVDGPAFADLARGQGERVLVVEDEAGARDGLRDILTLLGYSVTVAGSGEDAERLPAEPAFDVLLTDLMLPGIPGATVAKRLLARWPNLAVVLMSGYAGDTAVRLQIGAGNLHFLQKPFDMEALAREVRAALDRNPRA